MKLEVTEKQRRFVEAYMGVAKGNATEAASLAGYTGNRNTLAVRGKQLLELPRIQEQIQKRADSDPLVMDRKEHQQLMTSIARGESVVIHRRKVRGKDEVEEITDVAPVKERLKAVEQLGKTQGWFREIIETTCPTCKANEGQRLDLSLLSIDELAEYERLTLKATPQ